MATAPHSATQAPTTQPFGYVPVPPSKRGPWRVDDVVVTKDEVLLQNLRWMRDNRAEMCVEPGTHWREGGATRHDAIQALLALEQSAPIDMILHCPACGEQHIDAPEVPLLDRAGLPADPTAEWTDPPHRSHLCKGCGHIWRPADVPTNGVAAIQTRGKADSEPPAMLPRAYLLHRLQALVPLLQESRDALCALTEVGRRLHGVSPTLAERMDAAGTYNVAEWRAGRRL